MPDEIPLATSIAGSTKWLTATTVSLAAILGTTYLAGIGADTVAKDNAIVIGAQHVPTAKLHELHHVQRMRAPLHDFFGIEIETEEPDPKEQSASGYGKEIPPKDPWEVRDKLQRSLKDYELHFLVMTVADPIDAVNNSFFDHQIDALQKALVADPDDSWLYSGGYLPWQAFKDHRTADSKVALIRKMHWYMDEPGVLLFRREKTAQEITNSAKQPAAENQDPKTVKRYELLLVYLVGETPTLGIQRDALAHSMHDIAILNWATSSAGSLNVPIPIRIVGPTFTGGAQSLKEGLKNAKSNIVESVNIPTKDYGKDTSQQSAPPGDTASTGLTSPSSNANAESRIEPVRTQSAGATKSFPVNQVSFNPLVINGSATAIADDYFNESGIHYVARTVCGDEETFKELCRVAGSSPIIWLTETGTAFSHSVRQHRKYWRKQSEIDSGRKNIFIPVPLGIARVRGAFERQLTAAKQQMVGLPLIASTSPLPFDADETAHDSPAIQTPQITAPAAELILNQIMRFVISEGAPFVGLMFTDVRDSIFLAEMLKLHCPQVQLLIAESDVLLTHTSYTDSLRGTVVASSYPHFAEGLRACRREEQSLAVMGGPAQYGIFNAILLHRLLERTGHDLKTDKYGNGSLDLRMQDGTVLKDYSVGLMVDSDRIGPKVWLHTVGYDQFFARSVAQDPIDNHPQSQVEDSTQIPSHRFLIQSGTPQKPFYYRGHPAWYSLCVALGLLWWAIYLSRRGINVAGDLLEPLHLHSDYLPLVRNALFTIALMFLGITTGVLIYGLLVLHVFNTSSNLAWLSESHFFSGITLLLPLFCSSAAGILMCYMKMRQSYLVSQSRTAAAGSIHGELQTYEALWIGCGEKLPERKALIGWFVVCVCGPIWGLVWTWRYTYDTSGKPILFWLTWLIIAAGFVLWWMASLELFIFQRQLRDKAKEFARNLSDEKRKVLEAIHTNGLRGVYRVLFGPSPGTHDAVATFNPGISGISAAAQESLCQFREIQYRLVIIKNQFYLLLLGSLLLFAAVVSYPFTSGMTMRSFATLTIMALVGGVCLCFWKLERDEALSEFLGTKPNEIEMNWSNLSFFASYGSIAVLIIVSQFVPGSWMTMGRVVGPLLHMGH